MAKPDQLFGKRKKHNLVLLNADFNTVREWITNHRNKEVTIGNATGELTHFLIEPFIPHKEEYYVSFTSERDGDTINFSTQGGIDIEDNWDNVIHIQVGTLRSIESVDLSSIINTITKEAHTEIIRKFVKALFNVFRILNFSYLEINPFTIKDTNVILFDTVAQLDDCAHFTKNGEITFPKEFGKTSFAEEEYIENIDRNSGASLKLTVLNPQGNIWNILGGGGASILYLDMIANLGKGDQIANYGETSGNPSTQESYEYAKTIIQLMLKHNGKVLFIVGGIANFTDVKKTFTGFMNAIEEYAKEIKEREITIFVRRGGPNYKAGLHHIKIQVEALGIPIKVYGPETSMPDAITIAREVL